MSTQGLGAALLAAVLALPVVAFGEDTVHAGDPVRGKAIYAMCMYCHSIDANRVGPMHRGLFGRTAGTVPGFPYSAAMKRAGQEGLIWDAKTLDLYLANPQKVVPGTRMLFSGIADAQTRADLIAYLKEATSVAPSADASR